MQKDEKDRVSGTPKGKDGVGRKEEVKAGADTIPEDAVVRGQAEWGQGERGAGGYGDAGQSELNFTLQEAEEYQKQKAERDKEEKGDS